MRNKGVVIALTIIISLLCIYYLSFTLISNNIQKEAIEYARDENGSVDFRKKQFYLDSVWKEPVYTILGMQYTYQEIKDTELSLGLDLQGGMHVVLEVSPVEIIKALSGSSQNKAFLEALEKAKIAQRNSQEKFLTLFYNAYREANPDGKLSEIFANAANKGRISRESTDNEVLDVIENEVEAAIERSFNIIRTRIDKFGTSQPNIQRLQGTGRIQVELPGVENPERVRRLLQGVAKLEFWEVYDVQEIAQSLEAINKLLKDEALEKMETEETLRTDSSAAPSSGAQENLSTLLSEEAATDTVDIAADNFAQRDSTQLTADSSDLANIAPLYELLIIPPPNRERETGKWTSQMLCALKDTARLNSIFNREDVKALIPPNLKFLWEAKPFQTQGEEGEEYLELHAIKTGRNNKAPLTGESITNAYQDIDPQGKGYVVGMQMNILGAKTWKKMTAAAAADPAYRRKIAIVLDDLVQSAPGVTEEIPYGQSQITGNFTIEEAKDLANILKAGKLPAPTRIVEEAVIGPSLGKEAQRQGIVSIVSGLIIVVLFMIAYYAKGGFVANLALLFNIFFILGILAQLSAALTLPGIAGIVLTIGMSIDANVLIFERIREELRNGVSFKGAIAAGYKKAFSSIIDSNVTTFLTALILFLLGQGPVKGFATTLMVGIACSFFSAVFITRVVVEWMARKGEKSNVSFATPFSKRLLSNLNFDFLVKRRLAYIGSTIFIVLGIFTIVAQGGLNLGVDFKGGRSYVVTFNDPVVASDLKTALSASFENEGTEVKTYGASNVVKVTTSYLVADESNEADQKVRKALIDGITGITGLTFSQDDSKVDEQHFTISSSSKVGATIADDIKGAARNAVILSLIVIFLYILVRFRKWQFGLGAVIALFHDSLVVIAAFGIAGLLGFKYEVDQVFIAAMLTIIGYSINDTVVVFDRIREVLGLRAKADYKENINISINNTISRTMITSFTTLIVIIVLLVFGGEVLRGFSFALLVGVLVGTYSSVFIATPVVVDLNKEKISSGKTEQAS